jgi:hypothetical protein
MPTKHAKGRERFSPVAPAGPGRVARAGEALVTVGHELEAPDGAAFLAAGIGHEEHEETGKGGIVFEQEGAEGAEIFGHRGTQICTDKRRAVGQAPHLTFW